MSALLIRNAEIAPGSPTRDVRLCDGAIEAIGENLAGEEIIDARGGALIAGLTDHHIHLFAEAARGASVDVETARGEAAFRAKLEAALRNRPAGEWLRVVNYHERIAGALTCAELDLLAPNHPVRVQHQSGALWMLNSRALAAVRAHDDAPACLERDALGAPTGRLWRGDAWLRSRIGAQTPDFAALGARLASYGVTAVTDTSPSTTDIEARILGQAHASGALPQHLRLMSGGALAASPTNDYAVGEVKIILDEASLPDFDALGAKIEFARDAGRSAAVHCATAGELAFTLAAFRAFSAPAGSRIEHGHVIPLEAIAEIRMLNAPIVAQPGLFRRRGDRFLDETPACEHRDLYRCASLLEAGVRVAFSSDAPYGAADPWIAIDAATTRRTKSGRPFGPDEAIASTVALRRFHPDAVRTIAPDTSLKKGMRADLCLLKAPLKEVLAAPSSDHVAATFIGGDIAYGAPF